tara:strand:+ start:265 stop:1011 length:747 start_codon:yes stop_codon:yes gene_type:complete
MSTDKNTRDSNHSKVWNLLKWEPNKEQFAQFIQYQKFLKEWNKKTNLSRLIEGDDFWISQICDSLLPLQEELKYSNFSNKYIDVGSGCGFPGMALAIAMPNSNITLLDSSRKKTTFLLEVSRELGLDSRITIITDRAESIGKETIFRGEFDYSIARAVAPASVVAEYLVPFLNSNGQALIYKGIWSQTEQQILKKALTQLNAEITQTHNFELPDSRGVRNIIRIRSTKKCPIQYPRSIGKPKKRPLGY